MNAERPIRLCRVIARLNVGGPARHVVALSRGLEACGFETTLFAGELSEGEGDLSDLAEQAGVRLLRLSGLSRAPRPLCDLAALFRLILLFRRLKPQIVHTHTAKAGAIGRLAALLAGVPLRLHTFHGHVFEGYFSRPISRLICAAERLLAALTARIIVPSERLRKEIVRRFRVAPRARVVVLEPGIALAPFFEARARFFGELRREIGAKEGAPLLGSVGRLVPIKRFDLLLRAFSTIRAAFPDALLAIAGDGTERARLESFARDLGVAEAVRFLGFRRDLGRIYADLDLFCLCSRNEGTPTALIEAMAAGVPCVATEVGGVADVLGEAGILVPPEDPGAFARAAMGLLSDPAERERRAAAGKTRAARFSEERLIEDAARLYRSLLAR
jgi:glycosyltransferase involved in cell wall biosynthesis